MKNLSFDRLPFAAMLVLATSASLWSQACPSTDIGPQFFPAVVLNAEHPNAPYYCAAANGAPVPIPVTFHNPGPSSVVVIGINPTMQTCSLALADKPVSEPSAADIGKALGVTIPGASSVTGAGSGSDISSAQKSTADNLALQLGANKKPQKNPKESSSAYALKLQQVDKQMIDLQTNAQEVQSCLSAFQSGHQKVADLQLAADKFKTLVDNSINNASARVDTYNALIHKIETASAADWTGIRNEANQLERIAVSTPTLKDNTLAKDAVSPDEEKVLRQLQNKSYSDVATGLAVAAVDLLKDPSSQSGEVCKTDAQKTFADDQQFLTSLFSDVGGKSSLESNWKSRLTSMSTLATTLNSAEDKLVELLSKPEAFEIVQVISPSDRIQNTETVSLTCTSQASLLMKVNVNGDQDSGKGTPTKGADDSGTATKPANSKSTTTKFNLQFGQGQRVYISGGFAVVPLDTHVYSTSAAPGAPTTPATYVIVDTSDSSTRILPMALVHVRMFDVYLHNRYWANSFIPNYLSLGLTAKSDANKGTSPEYLFGPSFASIGHNLFLTVGAYAGEVERLGDGLTVGSTTTLAAANLPITQQYHWKVGFALSYKIK